MTRTGIMFTETNEEEEEDLFKALTSSCRVVNPGR